MAAVKRSAVQEIFEDANAGRLDFFHARTLAYSMPGEMEKLEKLVGEWQSQPPETGVDPKLAVGVGLWIQRRYKEAEEILASLRAGADGAYLRGLCQTEIGDYDAAVKSFQKAIKAGQDEFVCAMAVADACRRAGEREKALAQIRDHQEEYGGEAELHYQKGRCLEDTMEYETAMEAYERAVELNPQHAGALFRLAFWHDLRGNDEVAIDYYEKAAEVRPAHTNVLMNLGVLYEDHGEYEKAAQVFGRVAKVQRDNARARMYVGDAHASMNMCYDEIVERRQSRTAALLRTPLSDFELSARSRTCLEKMNVRTLGDLARLTEEEMVQPKNFGETSLSELRALLQSKGLRFGLGHEGVARPRDVTDAPQERSELATPIDELDFSSRSQKCMRALGVETLSELADKSEHDLLQCQNFGQTSLEEVCKKLGEHGLKLKSS